MLACRLYLKQRGRGEAAEHAGLQDLGRLYKVRSRIFFNIPSLDSTKWATNRN